MAEEDKTDRHLETETVVGGETKMQTEEKHQVKLTEKALLEEKKQLGKRKVTFNKLSKLKESTLCK